MDLYKRFWVGMKSPETSYRYLEGPPTDLDLILYYLK